MARAGTVVSWRTGREDGGGGMRAGVEVSGRRGSNCCCCGRTYAVLAWFVGTRRGGVGREEGRQSNAASSRSFSCPQLTSWDGRWLFCLSTNSYMHRSQPNPPTRETPSRSIGFPRFRLVRSFRRGALICNLLYDHVELIRGRLNEQGLRS